MKSKRSQLAKRRSRVEAFKTGGFSWIEAWVKRIKFNMLKWLSLAASRAFGLGPLERVSRRLRDRGVSLVGADLDESPMANRRLDEVLAHHAQSVKILHRLRPFAVAMAGEGTFDPLKD